MDHLSKDQLKTLLDRAEKNLRLYTLWGLKDTVEYRFFTERRQQLIDRLELIESKEELKNYEKSNFGQ